MLLGLDPSAITRMSGSVPDARTSTRPSSPSSPSAVTIAAFNDIVILPNQSL